MMPVIFVVLALIQQQTFTFQSQGQTVEGYISIPSAQSRALILYFHRGIEDRNAVVAWGELLTKNGYAVAGYTADRSLDPKQEAVDALKSLRQQKAFASVPVLVMGASMGTEAASQLFTLNKQLKGLILIVPSSPSVCDSLKQAAGRPVLLIQAENDDVAGANAEAIRQCLPASGSSFVLPAAPHRFPPSAVSSQILQWLNKVLAKKS